MQIWNRKSLWNKNALSLLSWVHIMYGPDFILKKMRYWSELVVCFEFELYNRAQTCYTFQDWTRGIEERPQRIQDVSGVGTSISASIGVWRGIDWGHAEHLWPQISTGFRRGSEKIWGDSDVDELWNRRSSVHQIGKKLKKKKEPHVLIVCKNSPNEFVAEI